MKQENIVVIKSYAFALRIIKAYRYLCDEKKEFTLSKQLLRSGTSIGANIEEAQGGQTKKDFFTKITIAYKEARETRYWLKLLRDSYILEDKIASSLLVDCEKLLRMIGSIQKSVRP